MSVSAISAVCLYSFILASVTYVERKLDIELATFDLNGDGYFSGSEVTLDQEEAMYRVTADTGRTFAPFTGAVFSVIYFLITWLAFSITSWISMCRAQTPQTCHLLCIKTPKSRQVCYAVVDGVRVKDNEKVTGLADKLTFQA